MRMTLVHHRARGTIRRQKAPRDRKRDRRPQLPRSSPGYAPPILSKKQRKSSVTLNAPPSLSSLSPATLTTREVLRGVLKGS